jgi:serine phosphatase RsbU (regulator of sigma subunit)
LIQGKLDTAERYINKAIKTALNNNDEVSLASSYRYLSEVYYKYSNYNLAIDFGNKSFALAKKMELIDLQKQDYEILYNCYKAMGDKEHALINLENYILMKDSLSKDEKDKQIIKKLYQFEYDKKEMLAKAEQEKLESIRSAEKQKQNIITYSIIGILLLVGLFAVLVYKRFRVTQKQNIIISKQKEEVHLQKAIIEEHQKETIDSINYAKRIQYALLANNNLLKRNLNNHFVLFKPKDIVSGDFYWATEYNNKFYLAVCDCTGHGVPGAFMSLLNIGFLSEAIKEKNIEKPNEVFNYVRTRLIDSISNDGQQDGMDGILLCIDKTLNQISYTAANNEPVLLSENNLIELPKDKMPVGKGEKTESFTLYTVNANKGDTLYLYTDGYADQFGGPKGKKYKYKQLNEQLLSIHNKSMNQQKNELDSVIEQWKGNLEQVDDILVIGIKF